jgi:hypothetical protein
MFTLSHLVLEYGWSDEPYNSAKENCFHSLYPLVLMLVLLTQIGRALCAVTHCVTIVNRSQGELAITNRNFLIHCGFI